MTPERTSASSSEQPSHRQSTGQPHRNPGRRRARAWFLGTGLILVIAAAVIAALVLVPMWTHVPGGSSGQKPTEVFSEEVSATGDDGRTRTLSVHSADGSAIDGDALTPGERVTVTGIGFDAGIGIYVSFCQLPRTDEQRPGPCLGDVPASEDAAATADVETLSSRWINNDWAWRAFATDQYDGDTFAVDLVVPEPVGNGADCTANRCGIVTRADHTASGDRVQDLYIPVGWSSPR